jgi:chromosomal replication initiator protein
MNNNLSKNTVKNSQEKIHWEAVQTRMKGSFGNDIFESWLKKINFVEEFKKLIYI